MKAPAGTVLIGILLAAQSPVSARSQPLEPDAEMSPSTGSISTPSQQTRPHRLRNCGSVPPSESETVPLHPLAIAGGHGSPRKGADLGIADDRVYGRPVSWSQRPPTAGGTEQESAALTESRPGVFIAWRNTRLVEEVEVRVRNRGTVEGTGEVFVDVLDERGKVLIHLEPPPDRKRVTIPAKNRGGEEGKIVKMKADRSLNRLIDLYDRARIRYDVRATIRTTSAPDANLQDNIKVKSYNIPFRAVPGQVQTRTFFISNPTARSIHARWIFETTDVPSGWRFKGSDSFSQECTFEANATIGGFITAAIPPTTTEGSLVESRLSLIDVRTREVLAQQEWFLVHDTQLPDVTNLSVAVSSNGIVKFQEMVADSTSGVLEASGVWTEFSTDGGRTFSILVHNYLVGNFVTPTTFAAEHGPFRSGTRVLFFLNASDTAGNIQRIGPREVLVSDAGPPVP